MLSLQQWLSVKQLHTIRLQGKTLWDAMIEMYDQISDTIKMQSRQLPLKGIEGLAKIQEIMNSLRAESTKRIWQDIR